jgi:hypothetical protein
VFLMSLVAAILLLVTIPLELYYSDDVPTLRAFLELLTTGNRYGFNAQGAVHAARLHH